MFIVLARMALILSDRLKLVPHYLDIERGALKSPPLPPPNSSFISFRAHRLVRKREEDYGCAGGVAAYAKDGVVGSG